MTNTSTPFNIMPNNLLREFEQYQSEFEEAALEALRSGWYILGSRLSSFEEEFSNYLNQSSSSRGVIEKPVQAVGVASGLDALWIGMKCAGIGEGDEVIVQANTYIASVMGVTINGATPVFVEPDEYYGPSVSAIEAAITPKTKAILVVHLYGIPCQMDEIQAIAKTHNLLLFEDCAQSHGATFNGQQTGTFGAMAAFSFYPTKNLGAFGDGGCISTPDPAIAEKVKVFRNYGSNKHYHFDLVGANSRLDEMQAGLLSVKLKYLDSINEERRQIAARYQAGIHNPKLTLPSERPNTTCVYHQYVVRTEDKSAREALINYLKDQHIGTIIHYPIPPHLSDAYKYLGYERGAFPVTEHMADTVLSIPMYNGCTEEEQEYVIKKINEF